MKVLLMSLAVSNRGDEAIGRSMLEALINTGLISEITILYNGTISPEEKITLLADYPHVKINHRSSKRLNFWERKVIYLTFLLPFVLSKLLIKTSSSLREESKLIQESDRVINAPGGVDIGPYKSWNLLWRLFVSQELKKPTAFYARSYGPLPEAEGFKNKLFRKTAKSILGNLDYVSLRDTGSQYYANHNDITHKPTVDCVFLDRNTVSSCSVRNVREQGKNNYAVVTINALGLWHPWYDKANEDLLDKLYVDIISFFTSKKIKVFLLPHLYAKNNDKKYCKKIISLCEDSNLVECLADTFDSYTQECIIRNSLCLVSARFHSIVFSIKQNTPFLGLSYEHKTHKTLQQLGLTEFSIKLQSFFKDEVPPSREPDYVINKLESLFNNMTRNKIRIKEADKNAFNIALETFNDFVINFLKP
ncbi:MAG: hypothetical protein GY737_20905 [Desulfobacteraceae bacterium]|nr:hypothetical protein [Desulfobacteraceae bacterium]